MSDLTYMILQWIVNMVALICVLGFGVYQLNDNLKTWEQGVSKVLLFGFEFFYEGLTGNVAPWKSIAERYMLEDDEVLDLVELLQEAPFERPAIKQYIPNRNGMSVYRIESIGVCEKYKAASTEDLEAICRHIVEAYFTKARKVPPYIHISLVNEKKLHFEVALSEAVIRKFELERQEILKQQEKEQEQIEQRDNLLEEVIELDL